MNNHWDKKNNTLRFCTFRNFILFQKLTEFTKLTFTVLQTKEAAQLKKVGQPFFYQKAPKSSPPLIYTFWIRNGEFIELTVKLTHESKIPCRQATNPSERSLALRSNPDVVLPPHERKRS